MKRHRKEKTILVTMAALALVALLAAVGCGPQPQAVTTSSTEKVSLEAADRSVSGGSPSSTAIAVDDASEKPAASVDGSSASVAAGPESSSAQPNAQADEQAGRVEASAQVVAAAADQAATIAQNSGMQVGVAIIDLTTGARDGYQADESMVSASMIKLAIAYAFLEQVAAGDFSLTDYYTIQAGDIVGGTGTIGSLGAGASVSYGELVNKMISVSDNTATNILIDRIGMSAVNATAQKLGLNGTLLQRHMMDSEAMAAGTENYVSANDVAVLLEMAYMGTFVNPECSAAVMEALEGQQDYSGILGGLPSGVMFAHKTGTLGTVRHDGGVVESEHPFVLVTLCGGSGFYEAGALSTMAEIGAAVNDALSAS